MVDCLCEAKEKALSEVNPQLYTIATLTGHAIIAMGFGYTVKHQVYLSIDCFSFSEWKKKHHNDLSIVYLFIYYYFFFYMVIYICFCHA